MRRKPFEKLLSILFVLLLISQPLVAAYAEGGDFSAEPADAVVQENDAVALPAEETDTPSGGRKSSVSHRREKRTR